MTRRYYLPNLPRTGGLVSLPETEAHHAFKVMRVAVGDKVVLFDGCGNESAATITEIGRNLCSCTADQPKLVSRELNQSLHLAIALPKADRAKELVTRLTEIGATKVTPLVAERTQRPPTESSLEKLRRTVIEASKQCERNQLMEIGPTATSADFFQSAQCGKCYVAHPCDRAIPIQCADFSADLVAAVGPEGGFTDQEVQLAIDHGFDPIHLGNRIYRVETAAVVIASIVSVSETP